MLLPLLQNNVLESSGSKSYSKTFTRHTQFGVAGVLYGSFANKAAIGALTGTSSLTFSVSATLTGDGALSGSSSVTFSPTATLTGTGALTGTSSVTFSPTATLTGTGALTGTSSVTFSPTATLTGDGALSGTTSVTFSPSGTLTNAASGAITGTSSITFSSTGALTGTGALSGASSVTFSSAGTLTDSSAVTATPQRGGRSRKGRRYVVEVDRQYFFFDTIAQVEAFLATVRETADVAASEDVRTEVTPKPPRVAVRLVSGRKITSKALGEAVQRTQKTVSRAYVQAAQRIQKQRDIDREISRLLHEKLDEEDAIIAMLL